jgi:hypothetical protein
MKKHGHESAKANGYSKLFPDNDEIEGVDWLHGFLSPRADISFRNPGSKSAVNAMGFDKVAVSNFIDFFLTEITDEQHQTNFLN